MEQQARIVIVGGGIMGVGLLYHLAEERVRPPRLQQDLFHALARGGVARRPPAPAWRPLRVLAEPAHDPANDRLKA